MLHLLPEKFPNMILGSASSRRKELLIKMGLKFKIHPLDVDESYPDSISAENVLYLHLSHKTTQNFLFEPKIDTPKFVWRYLSTSNLLKSLKKNFDHLDMGVYLTALVDGKVNVGDRVELI